MLEGQDQQGQMLIVLGMDQVDVVETARETVELEENSYLLETANLPAAMEI